MIWALYTSSNCVPVIFFFAIYPRSLYYFRWVYTMWFLPHLFCRHELFTSQKKRMRRRYISSSQRVCVTIAEETARNNGMKFCTRRHLSADRYENSFLLSFFQLQLLWTHWIFTSHFVVLDISCFCKSLFGPFRFWASTFFLDVIFTSYDDAMEACKITFFSLKSISLWFLALYWYRVWWLMVKIVWSILKHLRIYCY